LKLAIVTRFPSDPAVPKGGVESVSVTLVEAMKDLADLELHVVTTDPSCPWTEMNVRNGVTVHRLPQSGRTLTFAVGRGRREIKEYLRMLAPDIVHAHDFYGLAVKDLPIPRVLTIHGFIHADTLVSNRQFPSVRSKIWKWFETAAWADSPHIIAISPYVRERLNGIARGCIHDIDNPISERFFHVKRDEIRGRIFSAACISPRKNTFGLLRGFEQLLANGTDAELHLAGAARDEAYLENIRSFIKEHGLEDRVKLLGNIDRDAVRSELAAASVFVLASLEENSPLGIEEAMAVGVPVIASNRCGMPYMVRDGESGYLIDPTDPRDIAMRVGQLLDDDELRLGMGLKGRQIAEDRFHPAAVAQRTYQVYLRAIQDRDSGGKHGI
jgi:glycosyltransferase involved in cell wall biosynthesis